MNCPTLWGQSSNVPAFCLWSFELISSEKLLCMNGDTSLMNHQSMAIMKEKEGRKLSEITGFVEIMTVQNMDNRY